MSEIKELIERLCPDGVEYKKLGEVAKRLRGTPITATTMKKNATEEGEIKVFAGGKTVILSQERYFSMKTNDWRHLLRDYVRKVTERPELQEDEVFRYVMAG